jgi:hypothetical protein
MVILQIEKYSNERRRYRVVLGYKILWGKGRQLQLHMEVEVPQREFTSRLSPRDEVCVAGREAAQRC